MNKWTEVAVVIVVCFLLALLLSLVYKACDIDPTTSPHSIP